MWDIWNAVHGVDSGAIDANGERVPIEIPDALGEAAAQRCVERSCGASHSFELWRRSRGGDMSENQAFESRLLVAFPAKPIVAAGAFSTWGATYLDAEPFAKQLDGRTWSQLDRAYLVKRWDALVFLSTRQLVAVLPAYLLAMLEQPYTNLPEMLVSVLTKPTKVHKGLGKRRFNALVQALDDRQRAAVADALQQYARAHQGDSSALVALDSFWDAYLPADEDEVPMVKEGGSNDA